uniref:Uncharacterized protein n=1 Tax=Desertifilum tharense IPPAS B-1220 TaxID=1781255 RepID=A0ACD5H0J7_9CYAN
MELSMKLFSDWGFTRQGWRTGEKGEYLTLLQGLLLVGFVVLPVYRWYGFIGRFALGVYDLGDRALVRYDSCGLFQQRLVGFGAQPHPVAVSQN